MSSKTNESIYKYLRSKLFNYAPKSYYLVSYPKSGRTWLRVMLSKIICEYYNVDHHNLINLELLYKKNPKQIPRFNITHGGEPHLDNPEQIVGIEEQFFNENIIHLFRDPRDVLVSLYYHRTKRDEDFKGTLSELVRGRAGGVATLVSYYNAIASGASQYESVHKIRYEDLHKDTFGEISQLMSFIGMNKVPGKHITDAIEYARFENMKRAEKNNRFDDPRLKPGSIEDDNSYKVRSGRVGEYKKYFSESDLEYINEHLSRLDKYYSSYLDDIDK